MLSLRRNAAWTLLGQLVFAACHWGGFILVGRLAGPEELGRYALALAVVTPILIFAGLQTRQLQVADATQRYRFADYLAVRLFGTACATVIVVAIALLGYPWQTALPMLMVGLARAFQGMSDLHYGLAQRHKRLDLVAQSTMLRGVLGLLALSAGYYLSADLGTGLLAMAMAWGLVWFLFDRPVTRRWQDPPDTGPVSERDLTRRLGLAWTALPLGIALMLATLNANIPRYFIEAMIGLEQLGLFVAMAHFVVAGRMPITAVCQAALPRLADLYAAGDLAAFRRLLVRLIALSALPALAGLPVAFIFGRELLGLVYGPQFADAAVIFPWVMLVGVVLYAQTPLGFSLTAMHQFKIQPVIFGLVIAVNVLGCLLLVPRYGLLGGTWGWLAAVCCQFALSAALHWRRLRRPAEASTSTTLAGPSES